MSSKITWLTSVAVVVTIILMERHDYGWGVTLGVAFAIWVALSTVLSLASAFIIGRAQTRPRRTDE
jgi:ABC-type nickel/cobalt efflux system permease component RcnA